MLRLEVEGIPPDGFVFVLDDSPDLVCGLEVTVKVRDLGVQIPCLIDRLTPYPDGTVAVSLRPLDFPRTPLSPL